MLRRSIAERIVSALPMIWLALFFALPFLLILKISFSQTAIAVPPYVPVFEPAAGIAGLADMLSAFVLDSYRLLISDALYARSYLQSLKIAAAATALLVLIGYPIAYAMARAPAHWRGVLLMLVILPFWTSFLIRVYAWINILQRDGLLNDALLALGIIDAPVGWLATDSAVLIGIVYSYLPFMILPLYAALEKHDPALLEAAADLGASPLAAFWRITLPLSLRGVAAGALLSFIPIVGEFVVPDLLGGSERLMIGQTVWMEFFANKDWPAASALSVVLLALLLVPILIYERQQRRALERET